ncbi:MAG: hypothetical protein N4A44_01540 [Alphaproteobacteria bacterium]|jgi:hypothetical protein|nr:hypothetical protein [Alphaproteobacteria bacterium]
MFEDDLYIQGEGNDRERIKDIIAEVFNLGNYSGRKNIDISDNNAINELRENLESSFLGRFVWDAVNLEEVQKAGELLNIIFECIEDISPVYEEY